MASILIIEDDPTQLKLYAKALRSYRLTCVLDRHRRPQGAG